MGLTKGDKVLIGVFLLISLTGIGFNISILSAAGKQSAEVYQDGRLVQTIPLEAGYREQLRLGGATRFNLVVAENGRIRVAEADCPDQICVQTGWVSMDPQQIVCLPYRVVIKVVSTTPPDIDAITK
jgi:hypothetical protein